MALYKGTVPRVLKVSIGQGLTFATYDQISDLLYKLKDGKNSA
jgi:hypothetical protein